jgi:hypothetical protein
LRAGDVPDRHASPAFLTTTDARKTRDFRIAGAQECPQAAIDAHVRQQLMSYGPLSRDREYFGFVYLFKDIIDSAVARGKKCFRADPCSVDSANAAREIPQGAKVLGEWHTHPQQGIADGLSPEDVLGAWSNRRIHCYAAYFSQPDGDILTWNPGADSVHLAMFSAVLIGNYRRDAAAAALRARSADPDSTAIIAARENPGSQCLSTNTNALTADSTPRSCNR